jgi:hypothetical protein
MPVNRVEVQVLEVAEEHAEERVRGLYHRPILIQVLPCTSGAMSESNGFRTSRRQSNKRAVCHSLVRIDGVC